MDGGKEHVPRVSSRLARGPVDRCQGSRARHGPTGGDEAVKLPSAVTHGIRAHCMTCVCHCDLPSRARSSLSPGPHHPSEATLVRPLRRTTPWTL